MLHSDAIRLNSGRNALRILIRARQIRRLLLPSWLCAAVGDAARAEGAEVRYYELDENFRPLGLTPGRGEWVYLLNAFGQLSDEEIAACSGCFGAVIVDNTQAYFRDPVPGIDTLYSCRKTFGVPDGALLYTDAKIPELPRDESRERMEHLLGRFECSASDYYTAYRAHEARFVSLPPRQMSALTENLLCGIDYESARRRREENFAVLHRRLAKINRLPLTIPRGAFMYPLMPDGDAAALRSGLIAQKIYVPILWQDAPDLQRSNRLLPLPCGHCYTAADMNEICDCLAQFLNIDL